MAIDMSGMMNQQQMQMATLDQVALTLTLTLTLRTTLYCSYCPAGSTSACARRCEAGTFNPLSAQGDNSSCQPCPQGFFCESGASQPVSCPLLYSTMEAGGSSRADCVCEAGR